MEEKQHTIDDKETLLRELNQQLQSNEQVTAEFQRNLLQHEQTNKQLQDTVDLLRRDLQQAVEEKQAGERRLREDNQQLPIMPQAGERPHESITPPKPELQQPQEKQRAAGSGQLQRMKRPGSLPQKTVVQQKAIKDMGWQQEPKAPEKMYRGSAAVDADIAYFNGRGLTTVHSYDSDAREWHRLPNAPPHPVHPSGGSSHTNYGGRRDIRHAHRLPPQPHGGGEGEKMAASPPCNANQAL